MTIDNCSLVWCCLGKLTAGTGMGLAVPVLALARDRLDHREGFLPSPLSVFKSPSSSAASPLRGQLQGRRPPGKSRVPGFEFKACFVCPAQGKASHPSVSHGLWLIPLTCASTEKGVGLSKGFHHRS
ncbi:hypothetical protein SKAU_G00337710 [Synaphobranchus kaupii]|uniref:Uncharacterized protein n=1 Tax=Synaphobranchus kaupii TaxID=118154 RepID=A0A9Q1EMB2_SYNKA|nr:hypothetical protein SKAU_G00337710 [Synaphobranchus kaupii]